MLNNEIDKNTICKIRQRNVSKEVQVYNQLQTHGKKAVVFLSK